MYLASGCSLTKAIITPLLGFVRDLERCGLRWFVLILCMVALQGFNSVQNTADIPPVRLILYAEAYRTRVSGASTISCSN